MGLILATPALLAGCRNNQTLIQHQRHDLLLQTPDGPRRASSVIKVTFNYYPQALPMTFTYVTASFKGQMPYLVLKEGPLLATLFPQTHIMVSILADHYTPGALDAKRSKAFFEMLPGLTGGPALELPKANWPKMVVFHNKADPLSVTPLNAGKVPQTLGQGYGVLGYQLSFVSKTPIEQSILEDMPWLLETGKSPIDGRAKPDVGKSILASKLYAAQFVKPL